MGHKIRHQGILFFNHEYFKGQDQDISFQDLVWKNVDLKLPNQTTIDKHCIENRRF